MKRRVCRSACFLGSGCPPAIGELRDPAVVSKDSDDFVEQLVGPCCGPSPRLVQQHCGRRLRRQRYLSSHPAMESGSCTGAVGPRWHKECGLEGWHCIRVARALGCKAGETDSAVQNSRFAQSVGTAAHCWPDRTANLPANTAARCSRGVGTECSVGGLRYIQV